MTMVLISAEERARAYRALMDGIRVVEERIAPLWIRPAATLPEGHRRVRARVTANGFRELDVLLAHWVGMVAMRPVRMAEIDRWREAEGGADAQRPMSFSASDIRRMAADYRHAAPPLIDITGCDLAA